MENNFLERIEANPDIMYGKPVIKGTRLTVEIILEKANANEFMQQWDEVVSLLCQAVIPKNIPLKVG